MNRSELKKLIREVVKSVGRSQWEKISPTEKNKLYELNSLLDSGAAIFIRPFFSNNKELVQISDDGFHSGQDDDGMEVIVCKPKNGNQSEQYMYDYDFEEIYVAKKFNTKS